jgi:hypothetical protein
MRKVERLAGALHPDDAYALCERFRTAFALLRELEALERWAALYPELELEHRRCPVHIHVHNARGVLIGCSRGCLT